MTLLLDSAISYAKRGWQVFPCTWIEGRACSCKDPECESPGKHPLTPHGLLDATSDPALVRDFWTKLPKANIAIVTGAKSGIVVIDIDDIELAKPELQKFCPGYNFRSVPLQKTGREAGWHLAFGYPGTHVKNGVKFLPGMDSRGDGGYIMAAPSIHVSGRQYNWKHLPPNEQFPLLPAALLIAINGPSSNGNAVRLRFDTAGALKGEPEGKRRETVFKLACKLRRADVPIDIAEKLILEAWRNCEPGNHSFTEREALAQLRDAYHRYPAGADSQAEQSKPNQPNGAWGKAQTAPDFCSEEDKNIEGLAKDLIVPGAITNVAAPRGIGKTLVAHAVGVAMAKGGYFRGEKINALRVLIVDRDNPRHVVRQRLRGWGARDAANLKVLTRELAPDLKDKPTWEAFPVEDYDVVIVDSVGSFTEGVTEKEGKETTLILATVLDLIHKGPAVLLLSNCTKDALNTRGRGEWQDRIDIQYEVRDATGFTPSGKKDWWQELPEAGESAWADRAARRKNRTDYRLAFVPSKFRLGAQPDPFCLELQLPKDEPWTLEDVTEQIVKAGEDTVKEAAAQKEEHERKAADALAAAVKDRHADGDPILKTQAEIYLNKEMEISQKRSRELITAHNGTLWTLQNTGGKGSGKGLFPLGITCSNDKNDYEGKSAVAHAQSGPQRTDLYNQPSDKENSDTPFLSLGSISRHEQSENITQGDQENDLPWDTVNRGRGYTR